MKKRLARASIGKLMVVGAISGMLSLGLVACSSKKDEPTEDIREDEAEKEGTETSDTPTESAAASVSEPDMDAGDATVEISENTMILPSGWIADTSFSDNVVVRNPDSSEMVMIETMPNTGDMPTTAAALAWAAASEDGNAGMVSETTVDGRTWIVVTYQTPDNGGVAYSDNEDGSISKLVWSDCTFDDAISQNAEYATEVGVL